MGQEHVNTQDVQALQERLARAEAIQEKVAAYIETVQPVADRHVEFCDRFVKRAHQVAGALADRGIIAPTAVNKLVDKLAADQTKALDLVLRIADMVHAHDFGKKADVSVPSGEIKDPFLNLYHFGDPRANSNSSPGNLD